MVRVSVIGCGNMGSALIRGLARSGNHTVVAYDVDPDALSAVADAATETTQDLDRALESEIVVLAVKPDVAVEVLPELSLSAEQTLVSIAAGLPIDVIESYTDATVVRVMPNLAAETGDMAGAIAGEDVPAAVPEMLADAGLVVEIDESEMDIATALNGSGPAFVFYLIGAMRDAGVEGGLEPAEAERLAAQTFKGAAETVLRSDRDIGELIEAVCSPGGTTIEGMAVLRDSTVTETVGEAVAAAERRSEELAMDADDA